jgi:hypothetical protein
VRHDGDHVRRPAGGDLAQRQAEQAAQQALRHRDQRGQGKAGDHRFGRVLLDRQVADLRPVAVGDDDAPPGLAEPVDRLRHRGGVGRQFLVRATLTLTGERVSAERDDRCPLHRPFLPATVRDQRSATPRTGPPTRCMSRIRRAKLTIVNAASRAKSLRLSGE